MHRNSPLSAVGRAYTPLPRGSTVRPLEGTLTYMNQHLEPLHLL
jgi:hypothetical protein